MREISVKTLIDVVEKLCIDANQYLPEDVKKAIKTCRACEDWDIAAGVLDNIIENFEIAERKMFPSVRIRAWPVFFWRSARMST